MDTKFHLWSISFTFYARIFRTKVLLMLMILRPDALKMFVTDIPLYFQHRTSSQVGDLSSSEDFNRYHTCPFCDFKTETAVGMAGHYRQSHADLLERAHKRPQNDEEPSTSQLSPMKQCAKCSYESRSFESLLAHVENEHGTKKE